MQRAGASLAIPRAVPSGGRQHGGHYTMSAGCAGTAAIVATALDEMSAAELRALLGREEQACTALIYCA